MSNVTINRPMTASEWSWLLALATIWGSSFFFIAIAVQELPFLTVVMVRVGLAAIALNLVLFLKGFSLWAYRQQWRSFFIMGLLNNAIPFSLIVWGQTHIASGLASILNATTPLFTVLVAHQLTQDEKLSPSRIIGILVGFAGAVSIVGPDLLGDIGVNIWAQIAILGAALSYAFASVFGRRFNREGVPPMVTATAQVTTATLFLLPLSLLIDQPWNYSLPSWQTCAALLILALVCTALAYIMYFRILSTAGATNLMLVTFLAPVGAIILGALFLQEELATKHFIGMALIGLGLAAIDGRLLRKLKKQLLS